VSVPKQKEKHLPALPNMKKIERKSPPDSGGLFLYPKG
jgi:hypothetical protein